MYAQQENQPMKTLTSYFTPRTSGCDRLIPFTTASM